MSEQSTENSPAVFDQYARYYDLLYRDKDYPGEARFVSELLRVESGAGGSVLELGCGTGRHAVEFARLNWTVDGVDLSRDMVLQAQERVRLLSAGISAQINFRPGDVRGIRTDRKYDAVASLFHVSSYQTGNPDLAAMIATAAAHLDIGGKFFFDFWYGPAVLSDPPVVRVKRLEDEMIEVTRLAEPEVISAKNQVVVKYEILIRNKSEGAYSCIRESHAMRYWFLPELELALKAGSFKLVRSGACYSDRPLGLGAWYGWVLAEKT